MDRLHDHGALANGRRYSLGRATAHVTGLRSPFVTEGAQQRDLRLAQYGKGLMLKLIIRKVHGGSFQMGMTGE